MLMDLLIRGRTSLRPNPRPVARRAYLTEDEVTYDYQTEKPGLFTENGQVMFLEIRDRINGWLKQTGALTIDAVIRGQSGSTWAMLACIDRLVELGEVRIIKTGGWTQYDVIVEARK